MTGGILVNARLLSLSILILGAVVSLLALVARVGEPGGRPTAAVFGGLLVAAVGFRVWTERQRRRFGIVVYSREPTCQFVLIAPRNRSVDASLEKVVPSNYALYPKEMTVALSISDAGIGIWTTHRDPQVIARIGWDVVNLEPGDEGPHADSSRFGFEIQKDRNGLRLQLSIAAVVGASESEDLPQHLEVSSACLDDVRLAIAAHIIDSQEHR